MMRVPHRGAVALACGWLSVLGAVGVAVADPQPLDPIQFIKQQPMIFFVAKGEAGACGPGCSEWIAAEGGFDPEVHLRLRRFLDRLARTDLPIFFHSLGGLIGPSMAVGSILRAHRMKAGVGHTLPVGCRETLGADDACRKLMQSGREFKSRLRESGAICASGCVYALIGASTRTVAYVARLGVHRHRALRSLDQPRARPDTNVRDGNAMIVSRLKHYVTQMGVDSGLVDLADKTDAASTHWMSRDDIARYGLVVPDGRFETRWAVHARPGVGHVVTKSVTRRSRTNPSEYRTATVEFGCSFMLAGLTTVSVRRDLDPAEAGDGAAVRITSGDTLVLNSERRSAATLDVRSASVSPDVVSQVAASDGILLTEVSDAWSRETRFSTLGLQDALKSAPEDCRKSD